MPRPPPIGRRPRAWTTPPGVEWRCCAPREVQRLADRRVAGYRRRRWRRDDAIDRVLPHPLWGGLFLAALLFLMFQAVFELGRSTHGLDRGRRGALGELVRCAATRRNSLRSLLGGRHHRRRGQRAGVPAADRDPAFASSWLLRTRARLPRGLLLDRRDGRVGLPVGRRSFTAAVELACAVPGISWPRAPSATGATGW